MMLSASFSCWAYSLDLLYLCHCYYCMKNILSVGRRCALHQPAKNTLPPLNFSLQPAALFLWLRSGSWLTPTRGDPDCHVTERSWLGKRDRAISQARSINWGGSGACGRLDKKALKVQRFPASRFPLPASRSTLNAQRSTLSAQHSRCMDGGVRSLPCRGPCGAAERVGLARASRWLGWGERAAGSVEDSNVKPAQTPMHHPKEGPAAGDGRGPFLLLTHGLWVWFAP